MTNSNNYVQPPILKNCSESDSDTSSVSSHGRISFLSIFLPFSTPCKFFLVVSHDVWIKETTDDRPLVM